MLNFFEIIGHVIVAKDKRSFDRIFYKANEVAKCKKASMFLSMFL